MIPKNSITHLSRDRWARANVSLIRKAICEFVHERLIQFEIIESNTDGWSKYVISPNEKTSYTFLAKPLPLDHLIIDTDSIKKSSDEDLDALIFIKEFRHQLGISDSQLPYYLEEINSTLNGAVFKLNKGNPGAEFLASEADFQTIEKSMTEGHPCFVANNGRIGFNSEDYRAFAPEVGAEFSLVWLAGHRNHSIYTGKPDLPYEKLISQELDSATIEAFHKQIEDQGYDANEFILFPVHPWQWYNKIATTFASEIAKGNLLCLGYGPDLYQAQQSIRTMYNTSNSTKFYTKSALSVLNMGFIRGLSLNYLRSAPEMAVWLEELLYNDPYIVKTGFRMLGEIASAGYINPYYDEFGSRCSHNKMLATLWRESPASTLEEGQRAMTMAALLHVDDNGKAFLPELISVSWLSTEAWLHAYLDAYLSPLLHCFYQHDLVFMPHGENIILILENQIPKRILLKDITEEAVILSKDVKLPENLSRMYMEVPEDVKLLSIFIDVFDDFFRFMTEILETQIGFSCDKFWKVVADNIRHYQETFPQLEPKFKKYDLFAEEFKLSCLNRLQIRNHRQMIDLDEPVGKLQMPGLIKNPLAQFRSQ
jgi:siderophore synthetase component